MGKCGSEFQCGVTWSVTASQASHHACCRHHIMCIACILHHACAPCWWGRWSGKISALEMLVPQQNKCPRKCSLFWARKVLEIFKYSNHSLAQNMLGIVYIFWSFSILEYLWNSLNIPGIFPQYSAFEYFLFFTVIRSLPTNLISPNCIAFF